MSILKNVVEAFCRRGGKRVVEKFHSISAADYVLHGSLGSQN